jgi:hypothetical protein
MVNLLRQTKRFKKPFRLIYQSECLSHAGLFQFNEAPSRCHVKNKNTPHIDDNKDIPVQSIKKSSRVLIFFSFSDNLKYDRFRTELFLAVVTKPWIRHCGELR